MLEYRCEGLRPITSDSVSDPLSAARIFANRLARQKYGRRGKLLLMREDERSSDPEENGYCFLVDIGDGEGSETVPLLVTEEPLSRYTRATALEAGKGLAREAGEAVIVYCRYERWHMVRENLFRYWPSSPGLTFVYRVDPEGNKTRPFGPLPKKLP